MLTHIRQRINEAHGDRSAFGRLYLEEPDGCVPEEFVGDDLMSAIKDKFYWPLDAVRNQLEREFGRERSMWIHIDPTYEDTTYALLTLEDEHLLHTYCAKAWKFWWPNEAEMKKELLEWHRIARERYKCFIGQYVETAGNKLYMVDFELTAGQYGQPFSHAFEARHGQDLERQIAHYLKDYYDGGSRREGNVWFYCGDEVAVRLRDWEEISDPMQVVRRLKP
ncbi:MAG: hypothetical protein ACREQA_04310 [Candidatus Binatia bacterium]